MVREQLTLGFKWKDNLSFANYFNAANESAVHFLQQLDFSKSGNATQPKSDADHFVYLWGKTGSGASHLLQAACQQAAEQGQAVAYLPLREMDDIHPKMFADLEQLALVCVDDVQMFAGSNEYEEALFHLYNRMRDTGSILLVAGNVAPSALPIGLADLKSRLTWGPVFHLQELTDENKIAALQLRAKARGFDLPEEVGQFLIKRSARDMVSLFALLDKLDEASLAQHRKLTIPFVRDLI